MFRWFRSLFDDSDPSVAPHIVAAVALIVTFIWISVYHELVPSSPWDPVGYMTAAGGAIGLLRWNGTLPGLRRPAPDAVPAPAAEPDASAAPQL